MQTTTKVEEAILEKIRSLPPDKQQTILDFTEFLVHKYQAPSAIRSPTGTEKMKADVQVIGTSTLVRRRLKATKRNDVVLCSVAG
jgi:hypothetical protein